MKRKRVPPSLISQTAASYGFFHQRSYLLISTGHLGLRPVSLCEKDICIGAMVRKLRFDSALINFACRWPCCSCTSSTPPDFHHRNGLSTVLAYAILFTDMTQNHGIGPAISPFFPFLPCGQSIHTHFIPCLTSLKYMLKSIALSTIKRKSWHDIKIQRSACWLFCFPFYR